MKKGTETDSNPKRIFKSNAKIVQTREYKMLCSQNRENGD